MYAVLGWIDGFGNDTDVLAIFKTKEEAEKYKKKYQKNCHKSGYDNDDRCKIKKFNFGEVDFDIYN